MNWEAEHLDSILDVFYPGSLTGTAIAEVIFGDTSPSGKLPYTIPSSIQDIPDELDIKLESTPGRTYMYL